MTPDPENTPLFSSGPVSSLPEFDPSKCIAIGDLLSQTPGPGSLAYSQDFREAAARRIAGAACNSGVRRLWRGPALVRRPMHLLPTTTE